MVLSDCIFGEFCPLREAKEGFLEALAIELRSKGWWGDNTAGGPEWGKENIPGRGIVYVEVCDRWEHGLSEEKKEGQSCQSSEASRNMAK